MSAVKYQLRVKGLNAPDGTIPVRTLLELLQGVIECSERGLRLLMEGASVKTGRPPSWLERAVDLTFCGLHRGSTVLEIEAPTLGDVIGSDLQQQDFWTRAPAPTDTALSLFSRSVRDTTAENLESEYYDSGVLRALLALKPLFKTEAKCVELSAKGRPEEHVILTIAEMEKAERLKVRTPEPQAFIVSGHLDAIQHSRKRFQLVLPNGQAMPGRVDEEYISAESLREFWGKDVTAKGTVHFKPSGRIQLLQAQLIKPKAAGDEVFAEMPAVQTEAAFVSNVFQAEERKDWLKEVWGKWPGDEPIEELLADLKR
jgi:hypothetical protein